MQEAGKRKGPAVPTTYLVALKAGAAAAGALGWYWRLPQRARQALDARTREHIERTYRAPAWRLGAEQARAACEWARAQAAAQHV